MLHEHEPAWQRAIPIALLLGIPLYFALTFLAGLPCWGHCGDSSLASLPFRLVAYLPAQFMVHATLPPLADAVITFAGLAAMVVTVYPFILLWAMAQNSQDRKVEQAEEAERASQKARAANEARGAKRASRRIRLG
jgi:hypothetical protein